MTCTGIFALSAAVALGVLTAIGAFIAIALIGALAALATGIIADPFE
jgi:hypothetical protein